MCTGILWLLSIWNIVAFLIQSQKRKKNLIQYSNLEQNLLIQIALQEVSPAICCHTSEDLWDNLESVGG